MSRWHHSDIDTVLWLGVIVGVVIAAAVLIVFYVYVTPPEVIVLPAGDGVDAICECPILEPDVET